MFKFMTAETAKVVLENQTLRWSTPRMFNDPFDVQFDLRIEVDKVEVRRLALQKLWDDHYGPAPAPPGNPFGHMIQAFRGRFPELSREEFEANFGGPIEESIEKGLAGVPRLHEQTREQMRNSKILCLTSSPENILMWTHYAGQHSGVAIRFRDIPGLDSPWKEAKPVNYVKEIPLLADNETLSDIMSGRQSFDMPNMIHRLVYTKSTAFSYEQELRLYSGAGRDPNAEFEDLGFHHLELDAVIFGLRTTSNDRMKILDLLHQAYPHAEALQAHEAGHFAITIKPC